MSVYYNCNLLLFKEEKSNKSTITQGERIYVLKNSYFKVTDQTITKIGLDKELNENDKMHGINCKGKLVTPTFTDCHTHLVFAGSRIEEFCQRRKNISYELIAKKGGGINTTVKATRQASEKKLYKLAKKRVNEFIKDGVTTIEIKSGYGLDYDTERKILKVIAKIKKKSKANIISTFLGAHTFPEEYKNKREDYVNLICEKMIPDFTKDNLIDLVDVYCEKIAFNIEETKKIFETAKKFNLNIRCHADQLSNIGASKLAINYNALSVDHCEYTDEKIFMEENAKNTVFVLLPGAFYFLQEKKRPPIELLRKNNVVFALASDFNPGTSPIISPLMVMNLAVNIFNLSIEEALEAYFLYANKAIGAKGNYGQIAKGEAANFIIWDTDNYAELCYWIGRKMKRKIFINGERVG